MTLTHAEPAAAPAPARRRRRRIAPVVAWVLLVCHAALLVAVLVTGEQRDSFADLRQQVAAGDVEGVQVGPGLGRNSRGFAVVEVHWRDGVLSRVAEVMEVRRPAGAPDRSAYPGSSADVVPVVGPSVVDRLRELQPGLDVERVPRSSGPEMGILDLRIGGWVAGLLAATLFATLLLLALGPETERATPWAWFWLLISPLAPLAAVALLALGGYLDAVPRPRPGASRLTGGWAFLLWLALGATIGTASGW